MTRLFPSFRSVRRDAEQGVPAARQAIAGLRQAWHGRHKEDRSSSVSPTVQSPIRSKHGPRHSSVTWHARSHPV